MLLCGTIMPLRAQSLRRVAAAPLEPGSPAVLRFDFDLPAPILPQWRMGIIFPAEFNRSQLLLAASQKLNGGFTVANSGDTLWVSRTGVGDTLKVVNSVDISIASVKLPDDVVREYQFGFIFWDNRQKAVLINSPKTKLSR